MRWNTLAEWVGEAGSGTIEQFREAHRWLSSSEEKASGTKPYRAAFLLSGLGFMDISWEEDRWAASKPCLTLIPSAGGAGVLVGGRTRHLVKRVEHETSEEVTLHVVPHRFKQDGPDAFFFNADLGALEDLANRVGISFEYSIAERLADLLAPLQTVLDASPGSVPLADGFEVERWRAPGWYTAHDLQQPGLYRGGPFGRRRHWFQSERGSRFIDAPTGFYAELERQELPSLRYRRESVNGTLFRPIWAPFPVLQERTAVMCSGLASRVPHPDDSFVERRVRYENVPRRIAARIAVSLGARLERIP